MKRNTPDKDSESDLKKMNESSHDDTLVEPDMKKIKTPNKMNENTLLLPLLRDNYESFEFVSTDVNLKFRQNLFKVDKHITLKYDNLLKKKLEFCDKLKNNIPYIEYNSQDLSKMNTLEISNVCYKAMTKHQNTLTDWALECMKCGNNKELRSQFLQRIMPIIMNLRIIPEEVKEQLKEQLLIDPNASKQNLIHKFFTKIDKLGDMVTEFIKNIHNLFNRLTDLCFIHMKNFEKYLVLLENEKIRLEILHQVIQAPIRQSSSDTTHIDL
jgi:hypothetical protein